MSKRKDARNGVYKMKPNTYKIIVCIDYEKRQVDNIIKCEQLKNDVIRHLTQDSVLIEANGIALTTCERAYIHLEVLTVYNYDTIEAIIRDSVNNIHYIHLVVDR